MPVSCVCDECGKRIIMPPGQYNRAKEHFCSRQCHMKKMNRELNPTRMTENVREKIRQSRMTPDFRKRIRESKMNMDTQGSYRKFYGRHEHRVVAEQMMGRALLPGEVVHHINGDKRDNRPENLMVFPNQAEHARWHAQHKKEVVKP